MFSVRSLKFPRLPSHESSIFLVRNFKSEMPADLNANVMRVSKKFFPIQIAVTFHFNNGEPNRTRVYSYGMPFGDFEQPTQPGSASMIDSWWWTSDFSGEEVTEETLVDADVNHEHLYAKWANTFANGSNLRFITTEPNETVGIYQMNTTTNRVAIDWNDGSPVQKVFGNNLLYVTHVYAEPGEHGNIRVSDTVSCMVVTGNTVYEPGTKLSYIRSLGSSIAYIPNYMCNGCSILSGVFMHRASLSGEAGPLPGNYSFANCTSLDSIELPEGIIETGTRMFSNCSALTSITLPESMEYYGSFSFEKLSSLRSINIPSANFMGGSGYVFSESGLSSVTIPPQSNTAGAPLTYWFANCKSLRTATIQATKILNLNGTFRFCENLTAVNWPLSVSLGNAGRVAYMFEGCTGLSGTVTMPMGMTIAGNSEFSNCSNISAIVFSSNITQVQSNCFSGTANCVLFDFSNNTQVPSLQGTSFTNTNWDKKIVVPDNLYESWKNASNWNTNTYGVLSAITKHSDYYPSV